MVVVVEAPWVVEVVELPVGAVVLVVVVDGEVVVVLVDDGDVDDGEVVVVVVDVVDVVDVVAAGGGVTTFPTLVPLPALPKMDASGLPEISSIAVMSMSASTKTMAAVPAMADQENGRRAPVRAPGTAGCIGVVVACSRSVAGASATAEISRRPVSSDAVFDSISTVSAAPPVAMASVGAEEASTEDAAPPLGPVPPNLRKREDESGARTTTCLTAC